jgi:hypothetical protein
VTGVIVKKKTGVLVGIPVPIFKYYTENTIVTLTKYYTENTIVTLTSTIKVSKKYVACGFNVFKL